MVRKFQNFLKNGQWKLFFKKNQKYKNFFTIDLGQYNLVIQTENVIHFGNLAFKIFAFQIKVFTTDNDNRDTISSQHGLPGQIINSKR